MPVGGFSGILQQLKLRRLLGLDESESSNTPPILEEEDESDLFQDPASMGAYKDHIRNVPTRENNQLRNRDRILTGLSAIFQKHDDPQKFIRGELDRPYNQAMEQYETVGKGLKENVDMEESSLGRQRLQSQYGEGLKERRASRIERNEDRDADRQGRVQTGIDKAKAERDLLDWKAGESEKERQNRIELQKQRGEDTRAIAGIAAASRQSNDGESERKANLQPELDSAGRMTGRSWDPRTGKVVETEGAGMGTKRPTDSMRKTVVRGTAAIKKARELMAIFDKQTKNGTEGTWSVGPGQGRLSEDLVAIGANRNPDTINLHGIAQDLANNELYALSGAQINNKEYERLRKTLADPRKSEAQFREDLKRFIQYHVDDMEGYTGENFSGNENLTSKVGGSGTTRTRTLKSGKKYEVS